MSLVKTSTDINGRIKIRHRNPPRFSLANAAGYSVQSEINGC